MYLPRPQLATLYTQLLAKTNPSSAPILILTSLTVDALCAVRIFTALLKRDFIPHTVVPVSGYTELQNAGERLVQGLRRERGGEGGTVVCVGCGGGVDLSEILLGADGENIEEAQGTNGHGVEVWVLDAWRPWNLENVFAGRGKVDGTGVERGKLTPRYLSGEGGVIVWDDGEIEAELCEEKEAYFALSDMPEITEDDLILGTNPQDHSSETGGEEGDEDEQNSSQHSGQKRKASSEGVDDEDEDDESERRRRRRRSNGSTPIPSSPGGRPHSFQLAAGSSFDHNSTAVTAQSPSTTKPLSLRKQKKQLFKLRRKHEATLAKYYDFGSWVSEPVSSMMYSLASELGREDNELLWLSIVGVESVSLSPFNSSMSNVPHSNSHRRSPSRLSLVKEILRDEVRRLNPPLIQDARTQYSDEGNDSNSIPIHARSPTDTSIRLSPEPRFLLIRHWSLYDSMLHSTYLATRLHVWNEQGRKRLHKLLAKMGISLAEANKGYIHLDMEIKRSLNKRLAKFAEQYNLDGLIPSVDNSTQISSKDGWGFVRSWGWRGTLSAADVATIVSAVLEVGADNQDFTLLGRWDGGTKPDHYNARAQPPFLPSPPHSSDSGLEEPHTTYNKTPDVPDWTTLRFFAAFDALAPSYSTKASHSGLSTLLAHIPTAQGLARAILRTGSALIGKRQIRHLRAFRMGVVREGPDVSIFTHPGALVKLAAWVFEAVSVLEAEKGHKAVGKGEVKEGDALVLGALDEERELYVVVGLCGGAGGGGIGSGKIRSAVERKEREEKKRKRAAEKAAKKAERARRREQTRRLRRERAAANGDLDSESEYDGQESDEAESSGSSSSSSSSSSPSSSEDDGSEVEYVARKRRKMRGQRNRFGQAFQEVVEETGARVRIDSFEHSVVEVRKEDLAGFLEALSLKSVTG
ncbi:hypothetical protein M433DRAFT_157956 [Acidomyces richmondensis BFW]|nr:hypothetical protein M433DRAFT_157956 [Acidomyces richmondensis BFW]